MYEALRSITSDHHEPLHTIERIEMLRFRRFFVLLICGPRPHCIGRPVGQGEKSKIKKWKLLTITI